MNWGLVHGVWHIAIHVTKLVVQTTFDVGCVCGYVPGNITSRRFDLVLVRPEEPVCPMCLASTPSVIR